MKTTKTQDTLAAMLALQAEADRLDHAMTADQYDEYTYFKAEQEAENAWLRAAESAGWEEALYESYIESGLRSRGW